MKLSTILVASTAMLGAYTSTAFAGEMVTMDKGATVSIHFIDAPHSMRGDFVNNKLPALLPAVQDAGGSLVGKFETIDVEEGEITPQHVVVMQWPNVDALETVLKGAMKDASAFRAHNVGVFTMAQDVSFELKENVVYEWFGGNPSGPETPQKLQTFFQNVIPTAMEYGRADAMIMQPVESSVSDYSRMIAGMATWPTAASFEQFTNTDVFRTNIKEYRNPAFSTLELINTYYVK